MIDDNDYIVCEKLISIFLGDLAAHADLYELLSPDTLDSIQGGTIPERLTFNKDRLLEAVATTLETYLSDYFSIELTENTTSEEI